MIWATIITLIALAIMIMNTDSYKTLANCQKINSENLEKIMSDSNATGVEFKSYNNSSGAIIDKDSGKLHVFYSVSQNAYNIHSYRHVSCNLNDIIESEVIIDNQTITKTARGSQIGTAIVGGVLAGGVGAIIGGLSGKQSSFEQVSQADIKLTINDLDNPIIKINFLDGQDEDHNKLKRGYDKDSDTYKRVMKQLEKWQGMFDVILHNKQY